MFYSREEYNAIPQNVLNKGTTAYEFSTLQLKAHKTSCQCNVAIPQKNCSASSNGNAKRRYSHTLMVNRFVYELHITNRLPLGPSNCQFIRNPLDKHMLFKHCSAITHQALYSSTKSPRSKQICSLKPIPNKQRTQANPTTAAFSVGIVLSPSAALSERVAHPSLTQHNSPPRCISPLLSPAPKSTQKNTMW